MRFETAECPDCRGKGHKRCERCDGGGQVVQVEGAAFEVLPMQPEDYMRDVRSITGQQLANVEEILRHGITPQRLDQAKKEARLQGRVDVHVAQIADRLRRG